MPSFGPRLLPVLSVAVILAACMSAQEEEDTDTGVDDLSAARVGVEADMTVGSIAALDGVGTGKRYRAVRFTAHAGDKLAVVAAARGGVDLVAYLLDAQMKTLARNDDGAPGQIAPFIAFDVPADGTYFVALRRKDSGGAVEEYVSVRRRPASGTYDLSGTCTAAAGAGPTTVKLQADIVYDAGSFRLTCVSVSPQQDVPAHLLAPLGRSYGANATSLMEPKLSLWGVSRWSAGVDELVNTVLELDSASLTTKWSRSGPNVPTEEQSCRFDLGPIFAP